jgi:hypothetical protein
LSENKQDKGNVLPVWGIVFLFAGIVLLLQALNVLPWALWGRLWKFWPVIIIIFGLSFLTRRKVWLGILMALAILGISLWMADVQVTPNLSNDVWHTEQTYSFPAGNVSATDASVSFTAPGNLFIGYLDAGSTELVEARDSSDASRDRSNPGLPRDTMVTNFNNVGGIGKLTLTPVNQNSWEKWRISWQLKFNRKVPLTLDVDTDVSYLNLDLANVPVNNLKLKMDVSSGTLNLPVKSGASIVDIDMNVSNLEITVPEDAAAKIKIDSSISVLDIDKARFPKEGDFYVSPGYDSAANRVELNIVCDLGRIAIK